MSTLNIVNQDIELIETLHTVIEAYEELYVKKIQEIRDSVLRTRDFVVDLSELFRELKTLYYYEQYESENKSIDNIKLSTEDKIKKPVAVLISGSQLFSGLLNEKVFEAFIGYIENTNTDIAIIGQNGKELFHEKNIVKPYRYFELPGNISNHDEVRPIIQYLIQYEKVDVFFGKFINLISQTDSQSNITGDVPIDIKTTPPPQTYDNYLFEPSLDQILNFFEKQIFTALFKQALSESELAQMGSRINSMEESSSHIENELSQLYYKRFKQKKNIKSKKQLQQLAGYSLWQE